MTELLEPTGDFNPIEQCFRCGFNIRDTPTTKGVLLYGVEDVLRYGPGFNPEKYIIDLGEIDEDNIVGQPIMTCSVDCGMDSLSYIFDKNPEQFTIHYIMLSAAYDVQLPGLKTHIVKKHSIDTNKLTINNNPKKLKRWGGTITYEEYRKYFTCPCHIDHVNDVSIKIEEPDPTSALTLLESDSESDSTPSDAVIDTISLMNSTNPTNPTNPPELEGDESDSGSETTETTEKDNIDIEHGKTVPEDEDIVTDPVHIYVEDTDYLENDDPEAEEGDFDFIPPDMKKHFDAKSENTENESVKHS